MDQLPPLAPLYSPGKLPKTRTGVMHEWRPSTACVNSAVLPRTALAPEHGPSPCLSAQVPLVGAQTPIYLGSQERPLLDVEFPLP